MTMQRLMVLLMILGWAGVSAVDRLPEELRFGAQGGFEIDSVRFFLQHFGAGWQGSDQSSLKPEAKVLKRSDSTYELRGKLPAGGSDNVFEVTETVTASGDKAFQCDYMLTAATPIATDTLALAIDIPVGEPGLAVNVDGDEISLPEEAAEPGIFDREAGIVMIGLPERKIRISGDFKVYIQDNRAFNFKTFTIRLMPKGMENEISNWRLTADFRLLPAVSGETLPACPAIDDCGNLRVGTRVLRWNWYAPDWHAEVLDDGNFKMDAGFPRFGSDSFETSGVWNGFRTKISAVAVPDGVAYHARFKAASPVETSALALTMNMPLAEPGDVIVDGRKIELPEVCKESCIFNGNARSLRFGSNGRIVTVEGDFMLLIQDDRKWGNQYFIFRIGATPSAGKIDDASLKIRIRLETPYTASVDLRNVFNMGFRDEKLNDGKGGWTDQGPTNDLRMMKSGRFSALGVDFDIVNPERNDGRSCLVLSSRQQKFPMEKSIALDSSGEKSRYLYLLHASAWTPNASMPVGMVVAEYADGSVKEFPVLAGRDVGNWWQPYGVANGVVAWTGENAETFVGLYLSQFPVEAAPVKLTFKAAADSGSVWMIVGATLGEYRLNLRRPEALPYIVADKDWLPVEYNGNTVAGSPLDFSGYLDAPAGKYGPVVVDQTGHFSFRDAPGKRIRFFGPNLVGTANYLDKELADDFVTKATRLGYNTVRFHHFDNGLIDPNAPDSLTFDSRALDQLDYLFAELKKHGIYSCLDLYASRELKPGDHIKELEGRTSPEKFILKRLIPLSKSAMDNWKEFARRLLTHRNPYTGLTYAEDPALYALNLVNENPLVITWRGWDPALIPLFEERYVEYLKEKGLDTPENRTSRGGLFIEFLNDLQIRSIEEQKRFLKEELKLVALVTDLNMISKFTMNEVREHLDFVDNHQYWDHPWFPVRDWHLPYAFSNKSSIANRAEHPRYLMPARIFGKPYTVTEFNFCNPNPYRVEAAPLIGGYAGLQDWDALYRFAWSHGRYNMDKVDVPYGFDIVNDPQAQLAERIINLLFMREYIRAAKPAFAFTCTSGQLRRLAGPPEDDGDYPAEFTELGLYGRIGTLGAAASFPGVRKVDALNAGWEKRLPAAARAALDKLGKTGVITSAGGQITLDSKAKTVKIVAPQCEVMTFSGDMSGEVMKLSGADRYQTAALLSLDGKKLAESEKLLFIQMPNLGATKQKFANERRNLLESWGQLPILLEKCRADVELALPEMKVEALKLDGSPNGAVPSAYGNGKLRFTADTASRPGGVMVYLLTR